MLAWDDLGYATMDSFGGPVECPNMARIAARGVKFANFHTTALCSPTRASLLTGRNATSNGMATIAEFASGFPGISTRIPFENGFISEVLAERGYNTYCVGKWHSPRARSAIWPPTRADGRWAGVRALLRLARRRDQLLLSGPRARQSPGRAPGRPEDGYHLADDMADKAVEFIRDAKVIDPDKPFFMYLAPRRDTPLTWSRWNGGPVQGGLR